MKSTLIPLTMIALTAPLFAKEGDPPQPNAEMKAVLEKLGTLGGESIPSLTPQEARKQPSPADAVAALIKDKKITSPDSTLKVEDISIAAGSGKVQGRLYKPPGEGPFREN